MRTLFFAIVMLFTLGASAQSYTRVGNQFIVAKTKAEPRKTNYTIKDTDGKVYPVYIGKTGACYIIRTSKNGNEYKKYLGKEISAQICKEMGIEYKPKTR